jgi:hypothetical protein
VTLETALVILVGVIALWVFAIVRAGDDRWQR